jgi:MinD-like ATPase involved in chromosome partitioning or flagellar assembly
MKLLSTKHSSTDFSLLINKVSSSKKSKKIVETMMDTVDRFLDCRLEVLGQLPLGNVPVDQFDRHFLQGENISLEKEMNKIIKRFTEKEMDIGSLFSSREEIPVVQRSVYEHDVRATI